VKKKQKVKVKVNKTDKSLFLCQKSEQYKQLITKHRKRKENMIKCCKKVKTKKKAKRKSTARKEKLK
jgi:hypothetical protein